MSEVPTGRDEELWLVDPEHPALSQPAAERVNEPDRPDRLAWNLFRTLAQWNTDVWLPSLLETAFGPDNPLSDLEWGEADVEPWRSGRDVPGAVDVTIEGPECVLLVEATFTPDVALDRFSEGIRHALTLAEGSDRSDRDSAYLMVSPSVDDAVLARSEDLAEAGLMPAEEPGGPARRPLERVPGWVTWAELGRLALDLAEEADPLRAEQVHLLVTELQHALPGIEL